MVVVLSSESSGVAAEIAEAATHHLLHQAAFADLLEHLAHLGVLAEELVHILHRGAGACGYALAAAAGDDLVIAALLGGHGIDDGLDADELLFVDLRRCLLEAT